MRCAAAEFARCGSGDRLAAPLGCGRMPDIGIDDDRAVPRIGPVPGRGAEAQTDIMYVIINVYGNGTCAYLIIDVEHFHSYVESIYSKEIE